MPTDGRTKRTAGTIPPADIATADYRLEAEVPFSLHIFNNKIKYTPHDKMTKYNSQGMPIMGSQTPFALEWHTLPWCLGALPKPSICYHYCLSPMDRTENFAVILAKLFLH